MDYLKKTGSFSIFGMILIGIAYVEFEKNSIQMIRLLSLYLGFLGLCCVIASVAYFKYSNALRIVQFTIINILIYFLFSVIYSWVVGNSILLTAIVIFLEIILGVFLIEMYQKSKKIMERNPHETKNL